MKRGFLFSFILLFCTMEQMYSQPQKRLIVYDFQLHTYDTLGFVNYNPNIQSAHTNFYLGNYSNEVNLLYLNPPVDSVFPDSKFTYKQPAADHFDLTQFPVRTTVRINRVTNGEVKQKCSGSLVSSRHILSAGHCFFDMLTDSLLYDTLSVSPVFDKGRYSEVFENASIVKVYKFENWWNQRDIVIAELDKPIGEKTGWIGIGFENDDNQLKNKMFYKFSYPGGCFPWEDPCMYNGDTLYFSYGYIDVIRPEMLGVHSGIGIPGESGSSLISVDQSRYISYGILLFSTQLNHLRIRDDVFYAFKPILDPYLTVNNEMIQPEKLVVYPNPATDFIRFQLSAEKDIEISLYSINGMKVYGEHKKGCVSGEIDINRFPTGMYILQIQAGENKYMEKVIKK